MWHYVRKRWTSCFYGGGQSPHTSKDPTFSQASFHLLRLFGPPVIGSPNVTDSLNPSYILRSISLPLFDPFMIPELLKCLLIEYHRKARGHKLWHITQGKSLQSETQSYFSAIKGTSNGGEVAHLFLFGETKWLALHRPAVHEC